MLNLHFTYSISRCFHSLYYSFHIPFRPYPIRLPSDFFLHRCVFIFRSLLSVFKSSARRARRCTLLFALLLINSFSAQIFTCMRSIEAIYIILVCECVWKEDIASIYNVSCLQRSLHTPFSIHTSIGSLNVTIDSDEFVDMLSASMRHSYASFFFPFFVIFIAFVIRAHLMFIVPCRMCCIKEYLCVCVQVQAICVPYILCVRQIV